MLQFLLAIPAIVLYGCAILVAIATGVTIALSQQIRRAGSYVDVLTNLLKAFGANSPSALHAGLSLAALDDIRGLCDKLAEAPRGWWLAIDANIEHYTSPEEVEGWFLTEKPRDVLPYEIVISKHFHSAIFGAFPGLLTGAGLTLTFVAILLALYGVHYDKANAVDPISGIDTLINGLSGKFLSSIVALVLGILFTLYEKSLVRGLRNRYEQMVATLSQVIPSLSQSRVRCRTNSGPSCST
jgi:hypothetical protein